MQEGKTVVSRPQKQKLDVCSVYVSRFGCIAIAVVRLVSLSVTAGAAALDVCFSCSGTDFSCRRTDCISALKHD